MTVITDEFMRSMVPHFKQFNVVILKAGPSIKEPGVEKIIWEHARRNFSLRADGLLPIVCPVADGTDVCGIGIFSTDTEKTKEIMDEDPGVLAKVFTYEIHPCRSFPGDCLPV